MPEQQSTDSAVPAHPSLITAQSSSRRALTIGLGLGLAGALSGAWLVGGQQGFDQIDTSGINSRLLPRAGEPAPDVIALVGESQFVRLSDFQGRAVWLNFWGSWCPPCRSEAPEMQAAHEELAPRGLILLAVSLDEPLSVAADYAELNGLTYLIAGDPSRELTGGAYPIYNFPTHILIDSDGIVRQVVLAELNREQFIEHAETILSPRAET
ncbi:MAG: TlpA family protein disulfide reductase [Chloroflexota bacterium]|nr:TlpA family protein disulfide reductase [Chloroflexota bacterium]